MSDDDLVEKIASAIENKQIEGVEKNFDQLFSDWTWEFCGLVREARNAVSESLREAIREALK